MRMALIRGASFLAASIRSGSIDCVTFIGP
jgi:hypothetical protein